MFSKIVKYYFLIPNLEEVKQFKRKKFVLIKRKEF